MATRVAAGAGGGARTVVLAVAPAPASLLDALRARNLLLREIPSSDEVPAALDHGPRAVLLPYHRRLRTDLVAVDVEDVLTSGALLGVVLPPGAAPDDRAGAHEILLTVLDSDLEPLVNEGAVRILDTDEVAEVCAAHEPGRDQDRSLNINCGMPPVALDGVEEALLRRSFAGYQTVDLTDLSGGFTGSRLLRVKATDPRGQTCAPYVIKIGAHAAVVRERETTREFVADWIPFPNHPTIVHDRCVVGARKRTLVSRLVDQADRLDVFVTRANDESEVAMSVALIFGGALRVWRSQWRSQRVSLARHYRERPVAVMPDAAKLGPAFEEARRSDPAVGPPDELLREFDRVGSRRADVRMCLAHGDLHVRNVFARRDQIDPDAGPRFTDVVLIDFERAGVEGHVARDLATLDVSLTLDALGEVGTSGGLPSLSFPEAAALFPPDLLNAAVLPRRSRRDIAVAAVRVQAVRERLNPLEYAVALVAHLARYAKFVDSQGATRCAVAYRLAWHVLQSLSAAVPAALGPSGR